VIPSACSAASLLRRTVAAALLCLLTAALAHAQERHRWTVDSKSSLAWWQVDPHLQHLWATTCPAEPSWQPGEARSSGWNVYPPDPETYQGSVSDTIHVPLYPRITARPLCKEAVQGHVVVPDPLSGRGARGEVIIKPDSLVMGETRRAQYARDMVFETRRYPEIRFRLDSLVNVTRQADTLHGTAVGVLFLHGYEKTVSAVVKVYPDSEAGGTRVLARIRAPARAFQADFWPGCNYRGCVFSLGVRFNIWKTFFFGADLVLRPEEPRHPGRSPDGRVGASDLPLPRTN
jgi:polyisoprenoid-binding protein YceI